ncbi:phage holin family protein [Luteimonas sp. A649]
MESQPPPPDLAESLRELRESGLAGISATGDAAKALRDLLAADVSLARSAAGRSAVFAGAAVMFGASAWLLLMTALIVVLSNQVGLPWWLSLGGCGLLSALCAWLALQKATDYFEHTRLKATRRQLARLGIGELSELMPSAGSAESARAAEATLRDSARAAGATPP